MPAVTPNQLFPYPLMGEAVDATSWQNLATAVDASLSAADALRTDALRRPLAFVASISASQALTTAVAANVLYNTDVAVNPSSMHSTSVNTDQIVVPTPGIYYCAAGAQFQNTSGGVTSGKLGFTVNGTAWAARSNYGIPTTPWVMSAFGMVICQNAGDIVRASVRAVAAGTLTLSSVTTPITFLLVYRVSRL